MTWADDDEDKPPRQVVRELTQFVEEARGLTFKRPVKTEFLADRAFRERLLGEEKPTAEDRREAEHLEGVLRAFGLLEDDIDLIETYDSLLGEGVVGFYSYKTKGLVVRGQRMTPYTRSVLAHELTHALDDQHFGLRRPKLEDDSEAQAALDALIEGNAVRVQNEYVASLPFDEQVAAETGGGGGGLPDDVPDVLIQSLLFPYRYGPRLVEQVLDRGGEREVDRAFRKPPSTTEHILVPDTFFAGDAAKPVALPRPDGKQTFEDVVGAWTLFLVLRERIPREEASRAATGWGGDRFVAWADGDRTCVRVNFVMDTDQDLDELRDALEEWSEGEDASVSGDEPLVLNSCG